MSAFQIAALLLTLSALFSYVNHRWLRLPTTIGLMLIALVFSLILIGAAMFAPAIHEQAADLLARIDLDETLLHGFLGFLLFAGALHVNLGDLRDHGGTVSVLATVGVLISTAIVGALIALAAGALGLPLRPIDCFIFGALISPTDPIAVLAILRDIRAPKAMEVQIAGESLFNDGVGVVVFLALLGVASGTHGFDVGALGILFFQEAIGGALFGMAIGWLAYRMCKSIDQYQVEILISLAVVAGGYALADKLHVSGPIAMVTAGLLLGNHGRSFAMSDKTREHLDNFWELVDEILNAVLFVIIGLELLALRYHPTWLLLGATAIPVVLLARWISVAAPITGMRRRIAFARGSIRVLTWGGLLGGISVALALSLPAGEAREIILVVTYVVVVFSILVQGLTVGRLLSRFSAS